MSSSLTLQDNSIKYINGINSIGSHLSQGFEKLLDEAIRNEKSQLPRKLDPKAINELIKLFTEIIFLLSSSSSLSIFDVNFKLHKGELGAFSRLVPQEELLKEIELVVNRNAKKRKQYFYGPFEKVQTLLKEINQNMKPPVAYYIYGVAEKMIYLILKNSVYYEESTKLNEPIISQTTIQTVVKLLEFRKTADAQSHRPTCIPSNYDKCAEQLRNFLQSSYDQCNIILRVFFDPVKSKSPDSIKQIHRLVSSFMNIFRAMLESIEDMNDHVSSGGSGRNIEQGLIGYCLEGPAEDYLLYDFTTYTSSVINSQCKSELLSVVEDEEAVKALMNRGRSIMQTVITKYECGRGSCWPWLHKGCVHCSVLNTNSNVNEGFIANEHMALSSQMVDSSDSPLLDSKSFSKCNYLLNCYIYLLPRLLFVPIFHFLYLQELIEQLSRLSYNEEDQISLKEVVSFFHGRRKDIVDILKTVPNLETIYNRLSLLHLKEFQPMCDELKCSFKKISMKLEEINSISGNRSQELIHYSNSELIMVGDLLVQNYNKRFVRRTVYLFNNVLLIYKLQEASWKPPLTIQNSQFKLKKIIPLDCIHIIDGENLNSGNLGQNFEIHLENIGGSNFHGEDAFLSNDNKSKTNIYFGFRLQYQDQKPSNGSMTIQTMNFATISSEDKCDWMACLLQIQTSKLFEKYIKELPKQEIPLRLPHPKKYKFSEPDSNENIRFEKTENDGFLEISDEEDNNEDMSFTEYNYYSSNKKTFAYGHPQIRYATLHKLIERLTYHTYHDLRALHMFLLAYRRFTTPSNLLDLLIERFTIPEPDFTMEERTPEWKDEKSQADQMLKRFKNSYQRRVQRRVIWVLLRWVQNPGFFRYDFANDPDTRIKLVTFVNGIKTKELQKACQILKEKCSNEDATYCNFNDSYLTLEKDCPPILSWDLVKNPNEIKITNIHPVELARQITLHEWDLYHKIEYWEVEGKETTSVNTPNLSKSKDFSNKLRNWLVYSILSEEHPEDRAVALMRVADIMLLCEHWNNLQGSQEARAALISASVFRLRKSFNLIIRKYKTYKQVFNNLRKEHENGKGHKPSLYTQEYENNIQKIEEADPPVPCVPFIAFGVTTKLIHTELKSPDTIVTESGNLLINFRKHRRLSQIIERYLSFQRLPYQFHKESMISSFLSNIDLLKPVIGKNDDDFERHMFEISEKYEPRDGDTHNVFELSLAKERRLSKLEQRHADDIANLTSKERLEISSKLSSGPSSHSSFTMSPLTARSISGLSSSTLSCSEPSTPTNTQLPLSFGERTQLGDQTSSADKSPTFIGSALSAFSPGSAFASSSALLAAASSELSIDSPLEIPPLPPRCKDMTRNEFSFGSPGTHEGISVIPFANSPQSIISPRLPPRLSRVAAPPPLPSRHSKD